METPNPENIKVATENFYLDPTHIKPIPSKLLSFLPEFYGYNRTKTLRLQESKELTVQKNVNLFQVIEGVSPDYAVIAQKEANADVLEKFDKIFKQDFGLSLSTLTDRFENRLQNIEAKASEAEVKASEAEVKASEAKAKASEAKAKASEAEIQAKNAWDNYYTVVNSNSWKITMPLRLMGKFLRWFIYGSYHWLTFSPTSRPRRVIRQKMINIKNYINTHQRFKYITMAILNYFPHIRARLKRVGQIQFLYDKDNNIEIYQHLSPNAKRIYIKLKKDIEEQKRRGEK
ncbi:hypothetical protein Sdiek1_2374 [Sulfurospirillum diekertiae]|uniref:Uncharacterized protein n=2 Tax=Sulfurospirillum diekertiae TaxID=1854492 RepID=A0A1Y0HQ91_9BACT|nr:hypothetical protein [Sulfurospirillum diekertiae]ARU49524.1 hypothetical protein Sdiek1_2374 [Sulfurospirillum diekertiae]